MPAVLSKRSNLFMNYNISWPW